MLIEGLPGSGKTSLAEWLCARLEARGVRASWIPELERDHPVIDRPTMRTAREPGYAHRCIARWEAFSEALQARDSDAAVIVEGCLFQSTVRFLVEHERSRDEIDAFLPAVERCLAPLRPRLVYLTQTDATSYLESELVRRKGFDTVSRIASYSAGTPFAVARGLEGAAALFSLYAAYRGLCDELVRRSSWPVLEVDAVRFGESEVRRRVGAWLEARIGAGASAPGDRVSSR